MGNPRLVLINILNNRTQANFIIERFSPEIQESCIQLWRTVDSKATVFCERRFEDALGRARELGKQKNNMQALVTGSLRLVGGALCLLERDT